jgi:hypothetical protein
MLAEYDAFSERFLEHCKQVPGLLSVTQSEDLSIPGRFIVAITFENRKAFQAWARSPELLPILQESGPNLLRLVGDSEAWVTVAGSAPSEGARPTYDVVALITLKNTPGVRETFESRMREVISIYERHGRGLAFASLVRLAGSITRYAYATAFLTAADAAATFAAPEVVRANSEDPSKLGIEAVETQLHEIVRVLVRQPAATG